MRGKRAGTHRELAVRNHLRDLIDQAKRRQLAKQPQASSNRDPAKRRASYPAYYWRNKKQIAERRAKTWTA